MDEPRSGFDSFGHRNLCGDRRHLALRHAVVETGLLTWTLPRYRHKSFSGGHTEKATPDPIPNSEVKLFRADGTAGGTLWESRTLPGFFPKRTTSFLVGPFFFVR